MKKILMWALVCLLVAGCRQSQPRARPGKARNTGTVLARVNDEVLTKEALQILLPGQIPENVPREKVQSYLERWVQAEVWAQEAVRQGIASDEALRFELDNQWRTLLAARLLALVTDTVTVPEEAAKQYFDEHREDYATGLKLVYMEIREPTLAQRAYEALKAGGDFRDWALRVSPNSSWRMVLGPVRYTDSPAQGETKLSDYMVLPVGSISYDRDEADINRYLSRSDTTADLFSVSLQLSEAVAKLRPGEMTELISSPSMIGTRFWLVKCLDRKLLRPDITYQDVRPAILRELRPEYQRRAMTAAGEQMKRRYKVEIRTKDLAPGLRRPETVLAKVGNRSLTLRQLEQLARAPVTSEVSAEELQALLERWVEGEIWAQEAVRLGVGENETLQVRFRNEERKLYSEMLLERVLDTLRVTDAEIFDYYTKHKQDYMISTRIIALQILDSLLAERIADRLRAGADFAALAKEFAGERATYLDTTRYFLRDDTLMPLVSLSPDLNQAIFRLEPNQVSDVVRVVVDNRPTFWIIKCVGRRQVKNEVKYDNVRASIMKELLPWKRQQTVERLTEEFRKRCQVEILTDNFYSGAQR